MKQSRDGAVVQLVRTSACHAGDHGFDPRSLRQIKGNIMAINAAAAFNKYCDEIKRGEKKIPRLSDDHILDDLFLWRTSMSKKHYYVRYKVGYVEDGCHCTSGWLYAIFATEEEVILHRHLFYESYNKMDENCTIEYRIVYGEVMKTVPKNPVSMYKLVPAHE